ncbi:MAG: ABC transporter permease [Pseudomonadota bacterium]
MRHLAAFAAALRIGASEFGFFWTWRSWLFGWMLRLFCASMMWCLLGRLIASPEAVRYLLLGHGLATGAAAALWAVPAVCWDRQDGTYSLILASPADYFVVIVGRTAVWAANAAVASLLFLLLLPFAFPEAADFQLGAGALLAIGTSVLATYAFGLCLGVLTIRFMEFRNSIAGLASILIFSVCGPNVPVEFWPQPVRALASVLPVTHALAALRHSDAGVPPAALWPLYARELLVAAGWLAAAWAVAWVMGNAARRNGSGMQDEVH